MLCCNMNLATMDCLGRCMSSILAQCCDAAKLLGVVVTDEG